VLVDMAWRTYYSRWTEMYRQRLPPMQWMKAGFALPFFPEYYKAVTQTLAAALVSTIRGRKQVIS
jgi:hypothetical protein